MDIVSDASMGIGGMKERSPECDPGTPEVGKGEEITAASILAQVRGLLGEEERTTKAQRHTGKETGRQRFLPCY
jgi:hypothetical protein